MHRQDTNVQPVPSIDEKVDTDGMEVEPCPTAQNKPAEEKHGIKRKVCIITYFISVYI